MRLSLRVKVRLHSLQLNSWCPTRCFDLVWRLRSVRSANPWGQTSHFQGLEWVFECWLYQAISYMGKEFHIWTYLNLLRVLNTFEQMTQEKISCFAIVAYDPENGSQTWIYVYLRLPSINRTRGVTGRDMVDWLVGMVYSWFSVARPTARPPRCSNTLKVRCRSVQH